MKIRNRIRGGNNLKQPLDVLPLKATVPMNSSWSVGLRKPGPGETPRVSCVYNPTGSPFLLDTQFRFSYIHPTETMCSYFDLV
jgi:hypothetical protein